MMTRLSQALPESIRCVTDSMKLFLCTYKYGSLFRRHGRSFSSFSENEFISSTPDSGHWRSDPQFQQHRRKIQSTRGRSRRKKYLFFNPLESPKDFALHWFMCFISVYYAFNLTPGESLPQRKHSFMERQLLEEAGLTKNDIDEIESLGDVSLSDADAENYGEVMDRYLEPREGRFTAMLLSQTISNAAADIAAYDPQSMQHPAIKGYDQNEQKKSPLPTERREHLSKKDHDIMKQFILEKKEFKEHLKPTAIDVIEGDLILPRAPKRSKL